MYKLEDINVDNDYIIKHMDMTISSDDILKVTTLPYPGKFTYAGGNPVFCVHIL